MPTVSHAQGNQSLQWDGKNDAGVAAAPGYYAVALAVTDSLGATSATWGNTIAVSISTTSTFACDHLNRLTNATVRSSDFRTSYNNHPWYGFLGGNARTTTYTFDRVGNRLSQANILPGAVTPVTTSSTYDKADCILTAGVLSYTFDADGNVRSRTPSGGSATTYAYDQANRLTGATTGGVTSSYDFDSGGKRVSRTSGGTTSCAVYDTTGGLPMLRTEAQGSVRVVTDSLGNTIESYGYDEFGASLFTYSATPPNNVASQPRQYTAEPRDGETGLIYLRARMYDPSLGRFLQRDTYRGRNCTPASLSRYVFVSENPVTSVDPSGHGSVGPVPELRATKIIQCAPNEPAWWYVEIPPGVGYVKTLGVAASGRPVEPTYPLICNAPGPDGFCWTAVAPFWIDAGVFLSVEFWYSAPMLETAAGCGEPPDWVQKWML